MTFHIDNADHKTSVNYVMYAAAFCLAFVTIGSPFLFPTQPKDEAAKTAETSKSEFADVGKFMTEYTDECVNKSQDRIKAWELAGEKNADKLMVLKCSSEAIDTFVTAHTKVPELKK
jgi:hypothetical protein